MAGGGGGYQSSSTFGAKRKKKQQYGLWTLTTGGSLGVPPPHPCFMCYITLITPLSRGGRFMVLVARLTTLGRSAGGSDAAGGVVITTSHTSWEGSLMINQLCF